MTEYIKKQVFHEELVKYQEKVKFAKANGLPIPPANDIIGRAIQQIAENYARRYNFNKYSNSWKEEMIGDAILNCIQYGLNSFNPEKSQNPFGYFTTVVEFSFIRRIKREKKEQYKKLKCQQENDLSYKLNSNAYRSNFENEIADFLIKDFENKLEEEKSKRTLKKGLEYFFDKSSKSTSNDDENSV